MSAVNPEPNPDKAVKAVVGLITLGGVCYLIYWCVKLMML